MFLVRLLIGIVATSVAVFGLAALSDSFLGTNFGQRTVSQYDATFIALPSGTEESRDVESTLRITYNYGLIPQTRGRKEIGPEDVDAISVTDGDGKPLKSWLVTLGTGKQIAWSHPLKWGGQQTVIVKFISRKAKYATLGGTDVLYTAEWPERFGESVRNASFTLILPTGPTPADGFTFPSAGTFSQGPHGLQLSFREDVPTGYPVVFGTGELTDDAKDVKARLPMVILKEKAAAKNRSQ